MHAGHCTGARTTMHAQYEVQVGLPVRFNYRTDEIYTRYGYSL